eukprot:458631-Pleurochrysis_carterae.AAC.1
MPPLPLPPLPLPPPLHPEPALPASGRTTTPPPPPPHVALPPSRELCSPLAPVSSSLLLLRIACRRMLNTQLQEIAEFIIVFITITITAIVLITAITTIITVTTVVTIITISTTAIIISMLARDRTAGIGVTFTLGTSTSRRMRRGSQAGNT